MKKVLVIEDNHSIRQEIVTILNFENYFVFEAENGKKGLEIAELFKIDIIICDIMMPEMNGFEVLKKIRENTKISYVPFIFLSALSSDKDLIKGAEMGADNYLMKPFSPEELLESIKRIFSRRVLIIDDNYISRKESVKILSNNGYYVFEADNNVKALKIIEDEMPEVIVSKFKTPFIDAFKILEKMKKKPLIEDIPFILILDNASKKNLVEAAEYGVSDFIIKSFLKNDLLDTVRKNISSAII